MDYGYRKSFNNFSNERYFHGVNEQGALFGVSDKVVERNALKVSLGFDYLVGNRSTVSVLWDAFTNNGQSFQQGETIAQNRNMVTDSIVRNAIADKIKFRNYAYGLGYKLLTDTNGGELNIKADYTRFSDGTNNQMYFSYLNGTGSNLHDPLLYNSQESSAIDIFSFNSDYAGRLNKSLKLEAGAKLSWVTTNARMLFNRIIDEREEPDPLFTNHFIYKERIQAAYASLNREFKTTTVQLGVRAERTSSTGNSTTKNLLVDTTYINFFPSFFVLQKMSGSMDVRFNYSRRINRPVYSDLNSFLYFGDPYTYFQGNPFLKPQYSNSYELTFTYKGNYNLSLNYLGTKGVISSVLMAYPNLPGATIGYRTNLGRQSLYTANVSGVTNISNWWSITNSLQLIVNRFKGNYDGNTVDNKKVSVSFNNNQEFSFSSRFKGQLSFSYNSPTVYSIYTFKSLYLLGAGMRISFLKDKLNVKLGIDDIFRSYQQTYSTANADFNMKEVYTTDSRRISVALTYQLSKGKSQVSNKSTGSREESQRARSKNAN